MFSFLKKIFGSGNSEAIIAALKKGAVIVDVRTVYEFDNGHVKGSLNIPLDQLRNHIGRLKAAQKPIITCCASGMRSASAKTILESNGIEAYNGGSWTKVQAAKQSVV